MESAPPGMERITSCTFFGYVQSTKDALLVFEAVRQNLLPKISRRLREEERAALIRSGSVFVFDEAESGVRRWTDGLYWSPSRILNNFLVYRQVEKKVTGSSEDPKSKSKEHVRFSASDGAPQVPTDGSVSLAEGGSSSAGHRSAVSGPVPGLQTPGEASTSKDSDPDRALVGSLTNSFPFRKNGLCKKTISFPVGGSHQHLISYYSIEDVLLGRLRTPSSLPELDSLNINPELLNKSNFRNPPQIEIDQNGVPRYRGEPIETPQNPRRKSGAPGSGDEQGAMLSEARGAPLGPAGSGTSTPGGMRMTAGPYSPASATGLTGPADDFRGAHHGHPAPPPPPPPPPHHMSYGHHSAASSNAGGHQQPFHFTHFDQSSVAGPSTLVGGTGGNGDPGTGEHFGNRRRVASDAPSRIGLRSGGSRYEPYPSSSFHSSDGGHSGMAGGGFGPAYAGSSDSHMGSPVNRRDLGLMGSSAGPGITSPADSRPQSARMYGEHSNGFNGGPGNGWRGDAGYVPVTPTAGSVTSSSAQSPRDHGYAPPLPPPIGGSGGPPPPPIGATVPTNEYFQHGRGSAPGGSGTHEGSGYYSMPGSSNHMHSKNQTRGTDWSNDGGNSTSAGGATLSMQGMPSGQMLGDHHGRLQSSESTGSGGYMYMQSSGSGSGGASNVGYEYSSGAAGGGHMGPSDRGAAPELSGSRSDVNVASNAPYYPSVGAWAAGPSPSSEIHNDATLQMLQHGGHNMPIPPGPPSASATPSSQSTFRHTASGTGPVADWRAAQETHHAHRSNSMSSEFSAAGGSGSMEWARPDPSMYNGSGSHPGGSAQMKSPMGVTMRETSGPSAGLERVVLRRPPAN